MLQGMREGAGKWLVWVIIMLLVVCLGLWGISSYFMGGSSATPPVAKVNGDNITQGELLTAYNRLQQTQPKLFTAPGASSKIKQDILKSLITQQVLYQAAQSAGFAFSDAQVNAFILQIPAFQQNGVFSQERFNVLLGRLNYTSAQFVQNIEQTMMIDQVRNGIAASALMLPFEADQFATLFAQKRDMGFMLIPASKFLSKVKVSNQAIKTYYQQHQNDFKTPEQVSVSYVEITPKSIENSIKPTTKDLIGYYENNLANFTTPARWHVAHILLQVPANANAKQLAADKATLEKIRAQAVKGTDFSNLAKQHSQDIITANEGGVMPWFSAGNLGPVFENTVAALKPGELSQPVQTRYGMELIKLLAVEKQKVKPYNAVANKIKVTYVSEQAHKIMADKQDQLTNSTFEDPGSLAPAAKKLKLTVQTSPLFTRKGEAKGLLAQPNIIVTAFSDDVLVQGNNSEVITLSDGGLLVLRVSKHVPAAEIALATVSKQISSTLAQQQAKDDAAALGKVLLPQLTSNTAAATVALKHGLTWVSKLNVARGQKGIEPQIVAQAFNTAAPSANQALSVSSVLLSSGDTALVGVSKVVTPAVSATPAGLHKILAEQLSQLFAGAQYRSYTARQTDKANVMQYQQNVL
jgi:peptidyl-prolyl cis-trans isomerase D